MGIGILHSRPTSTKPTPPIILIKDPLGFHLPYSIELRSGNGKDGSYGAEELGFWTISGRFLDNVDRNLGGL